RSEILITYNAGTLAAWGEDFVARVEVGLRSLGDVQLLDLTGQERPPLSQVTSLGEIDAVALYAGQLSAGCIASAPRLPLVGNIGDTRGLGVDYAALRARGISVVDTTRGWAQSVAEVGLNLMLNSLRQSAWWHARLTRGEDEGRWPGGQFCDNPNF